MSGQYDYLIDRRDAVLSTARLSPQARARIMGRPYVPPEPKCHAITVDLKAGTRTVDLVDPEPIVVAPPPKPKERPASLDVALLCRKLADKDRYIQQLEQQLGISPDRTIPIADVMKAFCILLKETGYRIHGRPVSVEDLCDKPRSRNISWPRHVCIDAARTICRASTPVLGRAFKRDHTSIMHALERAPIHRATIPDFAAVHAKLLALFGRSVEE